MVDSRGSFAALCRRAHLTRRYGFRMMRDFSWTAAEKKIARAAFDLAVGRELASVRQQVESMLATSPDVDAVWRVHDYLSEKRREIDTKYDYRYSVLPSVFARLECGKVGSRKPIFMGLLPRRSRPSPEFWLLADRERRMLPVCKREAA